MGDDISALLYVDKNATKKQGSMSMCKRCKQQWHPQIPPLHGLENQVPPNDVQKKSQDEQKQR